MNKMVNKCLLAGDKFMPKMHLRQPRFTYSACGPFIKKQKTSAKVYRNRRSKVYLSKQTR